MAKAVKTTTSTPAAAAGQTINLYATKKIDQGLTETVTRIMLENYKQSHGTTELAATAWKTMYTKIRDLIAGHEESKIIAALSKVIEENKNHDSINGVISMTIVKSSKALLELKRSKYEQVQAAINDPAQEERLKAQPARIQARKKKDDQKVDDAAVYTNMTSSISLEPEEIEDIRKELNSDSGATVVGYEMYERAGSLKNLQKILEKKLQIRIQEPAIVKLDSPYIYRTKESYCGKSFWYNEQILPVILIKKEKDPDAGKEKEIHAAAVAGELTLES